MAEDFLRKQQVKLREQRFLTWQLKNKEMNVIKEAIADSKSVKA